ncbi:MAG: hypothetical protein QOD41_114, partial [Cryptosporangiaceae bacterium]|nr:hypothetical protein [Cryptosporangiaceae bacterium]
MAVHQIRSVPQRDFRSEDGC